MSDAGPVLDQPDRPRTPPGVGTPLRAVGCPGRGHLLKEDSQSADGVERKKIKIKTSGCRFNFRKISVSMGRVRSSARATRGLFGRRGVLVPRGGSVRQEYRPSLDARSWSATSAHSDERRC